MTSKLPFWVWIGGDVLAFIGGFVNVVGLLGFEHQAVSHVTGMTSQLGLAFIQNNYYTASHIAAILFAFFVGALISGFVIRDSHLKLGRRYGVALVIESLLLCVSVQLLNNGALLGVMLVATACGLQNGMASTYSGAILRTTHVTGLVTDAGIVVGQTLAGLRPDYWRVWLALSLVAGFFAGGVAGGYLYYSIRYETLYFAAAATGIMGLGYGIVSHFWGEISGEGR